MSGEAGNRQSVEHYWTSAGTELMAQDEREKEQDCLPVEVRRTLEQDTQARLCSRDLDLDLVTLISYEFDLIKFLGQGFQKLAPK